MLGIFITIMNIILLELGGVECRNKLGRKKILKKGEGQREMLILIEILNIINRNEAQRLILIVLVFYNESSVFKFTIFIFYSCSHILR